MDTEIGVAATRKNEILSTTRAKVISAKAARWLYELAFAAYCTWLYAQEQPQERGYWLAAWVDWGMAQLGLEVWSAEDRTPSLSN